jgi:hypothetical protein
MAAVNHGVVPHLSGHFAMAKTKLPGHRGRERTVSRSNAFFGRNPLRHFCVISPLVIACPVWVQEAQLRRAMVHEAATKLPAEYIN